MSKKNEVTVVEKQDVVTQEFVAPVFESESLRIEDIAFSKLICLQPISEAVTDGKYAAGDIIDSTSGEKIGSSTQELEIFPLSTRKYYKVERKVDGKNEWVRAEPINGPQDMNKDWTFEEDGEILTRRPVMEVFLMAPSVSELPFLWRIQGMSYKGIAKTLYTQAIALPATQKKAPFVRSLMLRTEKEKSDKGVYYVFKFKLGKMTDAATYALCNQWYETTKSAKIEQDQEAQDVQEPTNTQF